MKVGRLVDGQIERAPSLSSGASRPSTCKRHLKFIMSKTKLSISAPTRVWSFSGVLIRCERLPSQLVTAEPSQQPSSAPPGPCLLPSMSPGHVISRCLPVRSLRFLLGLPPTQCWAACVFDPDSCSSQLPCSSTSPLALWFTFQTVERVGLDTQVQSRDAAAAQRPSGSSAAWTWNPRRLPVCWVTRVLCPSPPSSLVLGSTLPGVCFCVSHHQCLFCLCCICLLPPQPRELVWGTASRRAPFRNLFLRPAPFSGAREPEAAPPSIAALSLLVKLFATWPLSPYLQAP